MVGLAACGSSTAKPAASGSTTAPAQATTSAPGAAPVVMTAMNGKLGSVLVDSAGKTLYTLTNASGASVACTTSCLKFWPPLLLASGTTTATGAAGVTGLATVSAGGGTQVTEKGLPLFRFSGDAAAGDANGEGIVSFGGTWHAVTASGSSAATATTAAPAAGATTTTGAYGY